MASFTFLNIQIFGFAQDDKANGRLGNDEFE